MVRAISKQGGSASRNFRRAACGANLGFEPKLWAAADKLRGHMDAGEYQHVVLGLIFLKYLLDAFQERYNVLKTEQYADPEDRDEYTAANVFWVAQAARWTHLQNNAKLPAIAKLEPSLHFALNPDMPDSGPGRY